MQGRLSQSDLIGLLRTLQRERRSGLLLVKQGDAQRCLRLHQGQVVLATSDVREERLGETLVALGRISQTDLEEATQKVVEERRRLGEVLLELGKLDAEGLEQALAEYVMSLVRRVLESGDGDWRFEDGPDFMPQADATQRVLVGDVILEVVRRQDPETVRHALGDLDRLLAPPADPLLRFQKLSLTPADGFLLSRIDGTLTARELLALLPVETAEAERSLLGLVATGLVEFQAEGRRPSAAAEGSAAGGAPAVAQPATAAGPSDTPPAVPSETPPAAQAKPEPPTATPAAAASAPGAPAAPATAPLDPKLAELREEVLAQHARLKSLNHFEALGLTPTADEAAVKHAYFALARRYHPDSQRDATLADLREAMQALFIRIGAAYEVLRNPRTRASYVADLKARAPRLPPPAAGEATPAPQEDPELRKQMAQQAVLAAEKLVEQEKYWDAIQMLEANLPLVDERLRPRGRLALARALLKNPNWVKRAEAQLLMLIEEVPQFGESYLMLARLYSEKGLRSRAVSTLRRLLAVKPDNEEAIALLGKLGGSVAEPAPEEDAGDKGGLIKKLFGRG
jgi:DnaJ-domain-containing protein 1